MSRVKVRVGVPARWTREKKEGAGVPGLQVEEDEVTRVQEVVVMSHSRVVPPVKVMKSLTVWVWVKRPVHGPF